MSGPDDKKENPETFMDNIDALDGSAVEEGWNWLSNQFSHYGGKTKNKVYEWMGMEDVDGDGKRDFSVMDMFGSTAGKVAGGAGALGLAGFLKKAFKMNWFKSIGIAALVSGLVIAGAYIYNSLKGKPSRDFSAVNGEEHKTKIAIDKKAGTKNQFTDATNAQITFVEKDVNGNVIAGPDVTKQLAELKAKQLGSEERLDAVKQEELEVHNE